MLSTTVFFSVLIFYGCKEFRVLFKWFYYKRMVRDIPEHKRYIFKISTRYGYFVVCGDTWRVVLSLF